MVEEKSDEWIGKGGDGVEENTGSAESLDDSLGSWGTVSE